MAKEAVKSGISRKSGGKTCKGKGKMNEKIFKKRRKKNKVAGKDVVKRKLEKKRRRRRRSKTG